MTKRRSITTGEYYHLYGQGAGNTIFRDDIDRKRFLFSILYYQSPEKIEHTSRYVRKYIPDIGFPVLSGKLENILVSRTVELVCFCLLPNRFHLIGREKEPNGISEYMQRVLVGHTMYMNGKYNTSGHVFKGRYKALPIKDEHSLLFLSAYIHQQPRELSAWREKISKYPWSSLQDLTEANRWGGLLEADIIAEQFAGEPDSNYADFVRTVSQKDFEKEILELINPA